MGQTTAVLTRIVPDTYNDEHKHGANSGFEHAEEEALGIHALVVVADGGQDQRQAPESDGGGRDALDRVPLGENHAGIGADDEAEIEDGRNPRVAVAHQQVEIRAQAEQSLEVAVRGWTS